MRGLKTNLTHIILFLSLFLTKGLSHAPSSTKPECTLPKDQDSTLRVIHVSSPCSPIHTKSSISWEDNVLKTLAQDQARLMYLSSLVSGRKSVTPVAWGRPLVQTPTYLVRVNVGTPSQPFLMAFDTSSDAAWLPCNGCLGCPGPALFATDKSTSFKGVGCSTSQCQQVISPSCSQNVCTYNQIYGGSTLSSTLVQDTIALAQDPIPNYTFGCISKTTLTTVPPQGLLGLGRGPLSLLTQAQTQYKSTFSYCLPSIKSSNFSGELRLGPIQQPQKVKYTPLLKNPKRPSLYYINLLAIKVGHKIVNIPPSAFAFDPATGGGTIIDTGTVYTRLVLPAYTLVRDEFRRRMGKANVTSLGGFDTCYMVPVTIPTITLMFQGVNMTLPQDNFLIRSTYSRMACLAMAAAFDNINVIANMQQQNHRILFDVSSSRVGIVRENCS